MSSELRARPTIHDVARLAGVSVPTVSRVLTGAVPVSPARREAVLAAIKSIGFHPSAAARSLARGERPIVAVITSDTTVYGNALALQGIEEAARNAGLVVVITVVDSTEPADVDRTIDLVLAQALAGIIVLDFDPAAGAVLDRLPRSIAVVAAGRAHADQVPSASLDVAAASEEATMYLLSLGHETVHFAGSRPGGGVSGRVNGWLAALHAAGAEVPAMIDAEQTPQAGVEAGRTLIAQGGVTAVLCNNDEVALGVMSAFAEAGYDIPGDVSVVGFDDLPVGRVWSPALTSVRLDFGSLGRRTFALLQSAIGGDADLPLLEAPRLIIRSSTGSPRPVPPTSRAGETRKGAQ